MSARHGESATSYLTLLSADGLGDMDEATRAQFVGVSLPVAYEIITIETVSLLGDDSEVVESRSTIDHDIHIYMEAARRALLAQKRSLAASHLAWHVRGAMLQLPSSAGYIVHEGHSRP